MTLQSVVWASVQVSTVSVSVFVRTYLHVGHNAWFICWQQHPTDPFTILESEDQEIGELYVVKKRRAARLKAPLLSKGQTGSTWLSEVSQSVSRISKPLNPSWKNGLWKIGTGEAQWRFVKTFPLKQVSNILFKKDDKYFFTCPCSWFIAYDLVQLFTPRELQSTLIV